MKKFFIENLSKEDLKLFLEQLSEKSDIQNYEYRKAFWMAFTEYVKYAKLIVGKDVLNLLPLETQKKIKKDKACYATYNQSEQSAIYIDFEKVKIIEFTHNGKVRGYKESPIDLNKSYYTQQELISNRYNLFTEAHLSPHTYNWQKKVLEYMNKYLGTKISVKDIYIEEDREKREKYVEIPSSAKDKKSCRLCGKIKYIEEFYSSKRKEYGYGNHCKECIQNNREIANSNKMIECQKCQMKKHSSAFRKNPNTPNGYTKWCISCMNKGY